MNYIKKYQNIIFAIGVILNIICWFVVIPMLNKPTPRELCENYYNHVCTEEGELPEGVIILK